MSDERIPIAIWEGTFELAGIPLRCSVLNDGRRVINADDVKRFFNVVDGRAIKVDQTELDRFMTFQRGKT